VGVSWDIRSLSVDARDVAVSTPPDEREARGRVRIPCRRRARASTIILPLAVRPPSALARRRPCAGYRAPICPRCLSRRPDRKIAFTFARRYFQCSYMLGALRSKQRFSCHPPKCLTPLSLLRRRRRRDRQRDVDPYRAGATRTAAMPRNVIPIEIKKLIPLPERIESTGLR
jgi:hypothetical protein